MTIVNILCLIIIILSLVGAIILFFDGLTTSLGKLWDKFMSYAQTVERQRIGKTIRYQAYWFDKTDESIYVVQALGEYMMENPDCYISMDRVRDKARELQRKAKELQNENVSG